jgi:ribonuclease-3
LGSSSKVFAAGDSFQSRIGVSFNDPALLEQALTHASAPNEEGGDPNSSNERLEFLGDAFIGLVAARRLYADLPASDEGGLTARRSLAVRGEALADAARRLGIGDYLVLGRGERAGGGADRTRNLAGALEAVVGAVLLDQGHDAAEQFVLRILDDEIANASSVESMKDPKSLLQEYLQSSGSPLPEYRVAGSEGPDEAKVWRIEALLNGKVVASGEGRRKVDAERQAAKKALEILTASIPE